MVLEIPKSSEYAQSNIAFVGILNDPRRPQYVLIDSDEGRDGRIKFPGSRFRAPLKGQTLEDSAAERFEEQTGLRVINNLGLRFVVPARSRHDDQWLVRNVYVGMVAGTFAGKNDGRNVYFADAGQGVKYGKVFASPLGDSKKKVPLEWITSENHVIADHATKILHNFDWENHETSYMDRIPSIGVDSQTSSDVRGLGCGLAVSSIMLVYRPKPYEEEHVLMVELKEDKYGKPLPGYAGGKIERLKNAETRNLDPISCCFEEGRQEIGIPVTPMGLIGVACTPIDMPRGNYHNSIVTFAFLAKPRNPLEVPKALDNPGKYLEDKMEKYVAESFSAHEERVLRGALRMPDMPEIGREFFRTSPSGKNLLSQIVDAGNEY